MRWVIVGQGARTERRREDTERLRFLRVAIATVDEVDPTMIGVDRAQQAILPGGGVPEYVARAADDQLRRTVAAALEGTSPWIVVVHGPAKVGKSRSLFEALRACAQETAVELVAPVSGEALESLLTPGVGLRLGSGAAVLWLDDLEPFLNSGVTFQSLVAWHGGTVGRIVAATYGGKGSEALAGTAAAGLATTAAEVLGHAAEIPLEKTNSEELGQLGRLVSGSQAADLERHGLAAYVVAGPALERKLNTGVHGPGDPRCPQGVAVVLAAVDWARCGRTDPITSNVLRALWPSYLSPGFAATDEEWAVGLEWALRPVAGTIGLLQHAGSYRAYDYVVRLVRDKAGMPREDCWAAAIETATDAQPLAVGFSAYSYGRSKDAARAFRIASESLVEELAAIGGFNAGVVLGELGRSEEALAAYDEVLARVGDATEPALREQVATALFNRGVRLGALGRSEEELAAYDEVLARFGDATEPALREQVASAWSAREEADRREHGGTHESF